MIVKTLFELINKLCIIKIYHHVKQSILKVFECVFVLCAMYLQYILCFLFFSTKGTPICELNTEPSCSAPLGNLVPTPHHTVLFNTRDFSSDVTPKPYPHKYQDKWDHEHVRMPCSGENEYPVEKVRPSACCVVWQIESLSFSMYKKRYRIINPQKYSRGNCFLCPAWPMSAGHIVFALSVCLCVRPRVHQSFVNTTPTKLSGIPFLFPYTCMLFLLYCSCAIHCPFVRRSINLVKGNVWTCAFLL